MPYPKKLLNDYEELAVDLHPHWWYFAEAVVAPGGLHRARHRRARHSTQRRLAQVGRARPHRRSARCGCSSATCKWATTNFVITSDRVIFRHGVFAKSGIEIPLERVNSVHFNQSVFERMIGAGDLLIESGAEGGQQRFTDVKNPDKIQNLIHSQMEQNEARMRQGDTQAAGAAAAGGDLDVAQQLERLEALRDRGTLTDRGVRGAEAAPARLVTVRRPARS